MCVLCSQDGRVPEQKIKLRHGDTLLINTMEGNTMMNFFRRFLAGGFQVGFSVEQACFGCIGLTQQTAFLCLQGGGCRCAACTHGCHLGI